MQYRQMQEQVWFKRLECADASELLLHMLGEWRMHYSVAAQAFLAVPTVVHPLHSASSAVAKGQKSLSLILTKWIWDFLGTASWRNHHHGRSSTYLYLPNMKCLQC